MGEGGISKSVHKASRAQSRDPEEFRPVKVSSQRAGLLKDTHTFPLNAAQATMHEEGKGNLHII